MNTSARHYDILLLQEPWFGELGRGTGKFGPVSGGDSWKPILPCTIEKGDDPPEVMAYVIKGRRDFSIVLRTDLIESKYAQVLEIRQGRLPSVLVTNLYNATANSSKNEWVVDKLDHIDWPADKPSVITGDWNLHHPWWEPSRPASSNPSPRERETVDWLKEHGYILMNEKDEPTFFGHAGTAATTIDLTFINQAAAMQDVVKEWAVDRSLAHTSDHAAIRWVINQGEEPIDTTPNLRFNFKKADVRLLQETLREKLDMHQELFESIKDAKLEGDEAAVERAAEVFAQCLEEAVEKAVPERKFSPHAKEYWGDDLSDLLDDVRVAQVTCRAQHDQEEGTSEEAITDLIHRRNVFSRALSKAKQKDANEKLAAAKAKDVFQFKKWTGGKREYPSPAMKPRVGGPMAVQHEEKCELLWSELLPPQDEDPADMPDLRRPRVDEIPMTPVRRGEIRRAIFEPDQKKAPGPSGIGFRVLRWAWEVAEDEMVWIITGCVTLGIHPAIWKYTIGIALKKPGKKSYDITKSYRLIVLEEALGKVLESVEAKRFAYLANKHGLVAHGQFGGVAGRSTTDAALTFVNDVESGWHRSLVTSALTFDVAGAYDHVSHTKLAKTLVDKNFPLPMIRWVSSFVRGREMSISLDGEMGKRRPVNTGIPQGSPASPILFVLFTSPMEEVVTRYTTENSARLKALGCMEPRLLSYVDDGKIHISSDSLDVNCEILRELYVAIETWGHTAGIQFDKEKKELTHYTRRTSDKNHNPPIRLPSNNDFPTGQLLEGRSQIKWLGIIFDRKLTFKAHVESQTEKAQNVLGALRMLSNTQRGLRQSLLRVLYKSCVLSILMYASPVWWRSGGERQGKLASALEIVQNRGLRWICAAFKTTPIRALQIEAAMMPIRHQLDWTNVKYALRLNRMEIKHPIIQRLPATWRNQQEPEFPPPLPLKRPRERVIKHTRLSRLAEKSDPGWERIVPFSLPPWKRTIWDPDLRGRLRIGLKRPGEKKPEAAERHIEEIKEFQHNPDHILVYTDGSQVQDKTGGTKAGFGIVAYKENQILWEKSWGLGPHVEVYDAELTGLALAANEVVAIALGSDAFGMKAKKLHFYTDNSAVVATIFDAREAPGQANALIHRKAILAFLDWDPEHEVDGDWVPGHEGIEGNERGDENANTGALMEGMGWTSLTHARRKAKADAMHAWRREWRNTPPSGTYALADRYPPSYTPSSHFNYLDRRLYGLVTQVRTGHNFTGEYYSRFVPSEETKCTCGEDLQTREHILKDCPDYDRYRDILREEVPDLNLADILGTENGINALSKFIDASGAFRKEGPKPVW